MWISSPPKKLSTSFQDYMSEIPHLKLIRDKATNIPQGYGFIEFSSHVVAKLTFDNYNGKPIPAAPGKMYRLNWASHAINPQAASAQQGSGEVHSVFVGDVPGEGTDQGSFVQRALWREGFPSAHCYRPTDRTSEGVWFRAIHR
jgi:hypothetical protein